MSTQAPTTTNPAEELHSLATMIREYAESNEISTAELMRRHAKDGLGSDKTFKSILDGHTEELDVGRHLVNYRAVYHLIFSGEQETETLYEDFPATMRVRKQITRLVLSKSAARLLVIEGESATGKTCAAKVVERIYSSNPTPRRVVRIEGTVGWKDRPSALFSKILESLGELDTSRSQFTKMERVIKILRQARRCCILDETHDFGPMCLRAVKTLINETSAEFVLLAHPQLFRTLERENYDDLSQLMENRLLARIRLAKPTEGDVLFLLQKQLPALNGDSEEAARLITAKARERGNLAFVREVITRIEQSRKTVTLDLITKSTDAEWRDRKPQIAA
jgi:DNA transposition AAA+ family ATPase